MSGKASPKIEQGSAFVTMRDSGGEAYTGYWDWMMNRPQGLGTWVYENGDVCEGLFDKGKATGHCEYKFANRDKYIGNMKHGKAHGYGKKTFHNGSIYTGQFYRDVYHGQGYFLHVGEDGSNSRAYKGTWHKGEFVDGEVTMWGKGGKVEKKYSFMRLV